MFIHHHSAKSVEKALFSGGCFWCIDATFTDYPGVIDSIVGYTGGTSPKPTYKAVSNGLTDHLEAVEVTFNPQKVTYQELLDRFWKYIDPTDSSGQFSDRGNHYKTAIFYTNDHQKIIATQSKEALSNSGKSSAPIQTQIRPASTFYKAEDYHQDYFKKNTLQYNQYYQLSGRKQFIESHWPSASVNTNDQTHLLKKLTPIQYEVTQQCATEPPFQNDYWDHKEEGIYVDIVSGEPLFSSTAKFDSNTGWPSFTKPIVSSNITTHADNSLGMHRIEVKSKHANSHLGHLFNDGPGPNKLRYCINSASLKFIPKNQLKEKGYGQFLKLFKN